MNQIKSVHGILTRFSECFSVSTKVSNATSTFSTLRSPFYLNALEDIGLVMGWSIMTFSPKSGLVCYLTHHVAHEVFEVVVKHSFLHIPAHAAQCKQQLSDRPEPTGCTTGSFHSFLIGRLETHLESMARVESGHRLRARCTARTGSRCTSQAG